MLNKKRQKRMITHYTKNLMERKNKNEKRKEWRFEG